MIISMDLNASPLPEPEDDDEEIFKAQVKEEIAHEEHIETAVETLRREREERRQRLKRDLPDEGPKRVVQQPRREHVINTRFYDKNKLPPGWLDCPAAGQGIGQKESLSFLDRTRFHTTVLIDEIIDGSMELCVGDGTLGDLFPGETIEWTQQYVTRAPGSGN